MSSSGIIFFLQHQAGQLPAPHTQAPPRAGPAPMLTPPTPQGQFLCLVVLDGRLQLLYDFGEGLKEAVPLHTPPPLTAASKAVRPGPGGRAEPGGRDQLALKPRVWLSRSRYSCWEAAASACWCGWRGPPCSAWSRRTCWMGPMPTTWVARQ